MAGCGGGGSDAGGGSPAEAAAKVCEEHAVAQLDGKLHEMDVAALAASMRDAEEGTKFLTAPIVIEPGLASETKQVVECTVRFNDGQAAPEIIRFVFNW
ncbi:hypothetical protein P873_12520 [Arenimonas composti TR7-09 = DSM 18010]|uniref:Uncharacterized protein n=2 Tax=Arenimonas TaxID=490567 RepID=A0A091BXN3_9GAMM|nr:hypothetical protein P873_12520 [Arenimonas composti TR7-09 = DSM 18010]